MGFRKVAIVAATTLSVGAAALGVATPAAMAADTPAKHTSISVQVDRAHHAATVTGTKRGTLDVKWERLAGGKRELVTVRNAKHQLVASATVGEKRFERVLDRVAKHPGAIRHLWQHVKGHHAHKRAAK